MNALLLAVLLAPAGARAASVPADEPAPADFSRASSAPVTLDAVLSQFRRFDADLETLTTRFSQTLEMPDSSMRSEVEGTVAYRKPERFRIEHTRPERQTIVSDGKDIWVYRPDRDQVVQAKLADWRDADPTIDYLLRFGRYAEMLDAYAVSLDTAPGGAALVLRPKKDDASFTMTLSLSPEELFPESARMESGSVRMTTRFSGTRFNPELDPALFRFTPPPDADVFRDFKPPRFER